MPDQETRDKPKRVKQLTYQEGLELLRNWNTDPDPELIKYLNEQHEKESQSDLEPQP